MIADTDQNASQKITGAVHNIDRATPYIAKVVAVYSDRCMVDLRTTSGVVVKNVPVKTTAGLIDDEVYGELDLPAVGNCVVVQFLQNRESHPYVDGSIVPYLNNKYQSNQVPISSENKTHTKKLFEAGKENTYRKIYKSGTTYEVEDDGTIIIETPSGTVITVDEETGNVVVAPSGSGKIHLKGNSKSLVTYAALNAALQNLITALNIHVHTGVTTGAGTSAAPATPMSLDISAAEAADVKTD